MNNTNELSPAPISNDTQSASIRIAELFEEMAPCTKILLGIMRFLKSPKNVSELREKVDELKEFNYSVYTAADFSRLLEAAGALQKVDAEGNPLDTTSVREPEIVLIEGAEFYKPAPKNQVYWLVTEEGTEYLENDKPMDRMQQLFDAESESLPVFAEVLRLCDCENGCSIDQLSKKIKENPVAKMSRRDASYYVERLEKCSGLEWKGSWKTTEFGKAGLDQIEASVQCDQQA